MCVVRQQLYNRLDAPGAARRRVLELPPLLHGDAAYPRYRRPGRALPAPARRAEARGVTRPASGRVRRCRPEHIRRHTFPATGGRVSLPPVAFLVADEGYTNEVQL